MRRRHRRLFNLFAFSLLGVAIYLNVFRMNDEEMTKVNKSMIVKADIKSKPGIPIKTLPKPEIKK